MNKEQLIREAEDARRGLKKVAIVIGQNGWVFVGLVRRNQDRYDITSAACVRRWGTSKGLGEIALEGPTSSTILDHCPPVSLDAAACIVMDCVREKWAGSLHDLA